MKKIAALLMGLILCIGMSACSTSGTKAFEIKKIDMSELQTMLDEKQTFTLLVERDECTFCAAMNSYIEETKAEHTGLVVYEIDITDFHLMREQEGDMTLISDTEDGKAFLKVFPYFLYTPTMYHIVDGEPVQAGIGYNETDGTFNIWDVDSTIDWDTSAAESVWLFIEEGQ